MILEVPQLQVIDRLRDYSSCASDAMGLRLSLRGSGVRVHCRARWCADTSLWAAIVLSPSVVLVLVCLCADTPIWATIVLSLSVVLVLVCLCADTPLWARIAFSLSLVSGGVHRRLRLRRCGQGLRSRSPWFGAPLGLPMQTIDKVFDVSVVQDQQVLRVLTWRRRSSLHSCSSLRLPGWMTCLSWCNDRCWSGRSSWGPVHRYRARVDPRHQGGEGVSGTPGACSQVFCHPIRCMHRRRVWRDTHVVHTGPHHHHHRSHFGSREPLFFFWDLARENGLRAAVGCTRQRRAAAAGATASLRAEA